MTKSPLIDPAAICRTTSALAFAPVGEDRFAVWNRYYPEIVFLNGDGLTFMERMRDNAAPHAAFKGFKRLLNKLIRARLFYSGEADHWRNDFLAGGRALLERLTEQLRRREQEKAPYLSLGVFTHRCNMNCPYCIVNHVRENHRGDSSGARARRDKTAGFIRILDRILECYKPDQQPLLRLMLNGGEILLEWETVVAGLEHLKRNYPRLHLEVDMNTNGSLVTPEIAQYIASHKFKSVGISIDGFRETHNATRRYHNGGETFDDVIRGLTLLNRYMKGKIRTYQGTLTVDHAVDIEKLTAMKQYNFRRARLGFNLLGISPDEAKRLAELHYHIALRSKKDGWSVMDDHFKAFRAVLSRKNRGAGFSFFCRGLNDLAGKALYYNLDTDRANLLCHYVTDCHVPMEDSNYNIHHPELFTLAETYLRRRYETFETSCADCEAAGICRGGCVVFGLDSYNRLNEAACVFMRETWRYYLRQGFEENTIH